ncbi:GMC family oxidoreductase [Frankia sp. CNm7]|uniref:GMC family oxidoreductase n=1 Tax=Frankia nepalensis TaxID=1836974 RepID=A0A937R6C7_9ACTN|nr:GMC family oxidoreductase [Frankia nepalensis]MBL7496991.1 GMC family oxidoreductase [Frankia nepalensis]MBL7511308.1 GMC family oxidoreductase [Frankia nepalensis]MBL7523596.1 GMC family oxidoreductase [Frankia nepalensis]MBL7626076.1 GMC family oxidoreductase [Frankia nepalensis]
MTRSPLDFYADPDSGAWAELGYDPYAAGRPPLDVPLAQRPPTRELRGLRDRYDAVVVGSGAGGGVAAFVLASGGASVLVVERGSWFGARDLAADHIRNHRFFLGGDLDTPPGHPRALPDENTPGGEVAVQYDDLRYHHNAITVGGGTRFFGAQAWRFLPDDFRMASLYGVPDGSALADWPIGYDDLEPFYDKVEWELGVAGHAHPDEGPRTRDYPMAPFPPTIAHTVLQTGAETLRWPTGAVPLLLNTKPRNGRSACIRCGQCVGFTCPVDARNGTHSTVLPRALDLGADLITTAQVTRISDNGDVEIAAEGTSRVIHAGRIILAAGAVETARLLHLSGLGNDWVGDCLQGHLYAFAFGLFDDDVHDGYGPGPSIATRHFSHGNDGIIGGGLLGHDFIKIPTMHYALGLPPDIDRAGPDTRRALADTYRHTINIWAPVQEIPTRDARVRLASTVTDHLGLPVARLEGLQHPEDLRTHAFLTARAEEWLRASGATRTWTMGTTKQGLSGHQHQAGTARMSDSPRHGATDPHGKVWGTDRVYVADASLHVTNGGANPVLTIMALAWRTATHATTTG